MSSDVTELIEHADNRGNRGCDGGNSSNQGRYSLLVQASARGTPVATRTKATVSPSSQIPFIALPRAPTNPESGILNVPSVANQTQIAISLRVFATKKYA